MKQQTLSQVVWSDGCAAPSSVVEPSDNFGNGFFDSERSEFVVGKSLDRGISHAFNICLAATSRYDVEEHERGFCAPWFIYTF